ncbi:hypothetical protein MEP401_gp03 [Methylophilales phage MEP401]|nr:hypothetical protein MEP401_gp03 [Methylophilales phage MEP401]
MSKTDKWYNLGYGIGAVNTDELNTIYCMEFYSMFGKLPQPSNMSRPVLLNEIRKLQQYNRSSAHSG